MGRIGLYEYPDITLSECLVIGTRISKNFNGLISRRDLAATLGLSDRGGRFALVTGSLRRWSIVEGRGILQLTTNALKSLNSVTIEESISSRSQLVASVPFFSKLVANINELPVDDVTLASIIENITDGNTLEIEKQLPKIQKLLRDVSQYVPSLTESSCANPNQSMLTTKKAINNSQIQLKFSGGNLSLGETADNIEVIIALLTARVKEVRSSCK